MTDIQDITNCNNLKELEGLIRWDKCPPYVLLICGKVFPDQKFSEVFSEKNF